MESGVESTHFLKEQKHAGNVKKTTITKAINESSLLT